MITANRKSVVPWLIVSGFFCSSSAWTRTIHADTRRARTKRTLLRVPSDRFPSQRKRSNVAHPAHRCRPCLNLSSGRQAIPGHYFRWDAVSKVLRVILYVTLGEPLRRPGSGASGNTRQSCVVNRFDCRSDPGLEVAQIHTTCGLNQW